MLTSFGMFWGAEGAGARWPGADAALLVVVPAVALFAVVLVALLRRTARHAPIVGASSWENPSHEPANPGVSRVLVRLHRG